MAHMYDGGNDEYVVAVGYVSDTPPTVIRLSHHRNALHLVSFLNGNSRIVLDDLMRADAHDEEYHPAEPR